MERAVTIGQILQDNFQCQYGDFIIVNTVWCGTPPQEKKPSRFIFAGTDGNHIAAYLFYKSVNSNNVYQKLKNTGQRRILKHFEIDNKPRYQMLRESSKRLIISDSTLNIADCEEDYGPLTNHLPFQFTMLLDIDNFTLGSIIDVIGYVEEIQPLDTSNDGTKDYQRIIIASSRSKTDRILRTVALFGSFIDAITSDTVYAFMNVKVGEFGNERTRNKTVQTTANTVAIPITKDCLYKLPEKYHNDKNILSLAPRRRFKNTSKLQKFKAETNRITSQSPGPSRKRKANTPMPPTSSASENELSIPQKKLLSQKRMRTNTGSFGSSVENVGHSMKTPEDFPQKSYDFVNNEDSLKFRITNSARFLDVGPNTYPMQSNPRGRALLINNYKFKCGRSKSVREGTNQDLKNLNDLFKAFHFDVEWCTDKNVKELPEILDKFKASFTKDMNACVVAVLSHGVHGHAQTVDGKLVRWPNDIVYQFDEKVFPIMAGKPKIFIGQLCQNVPNFPITRRTVKLSEDRKDVDLKNMIEIFATVPGMEAERDIILGSPFVYVFVDTLMEHAHDTDLLTLLQVVQDRLKRVEREESHKLHCCWIPHHFFKTLYFNPGLYTK